MDSKKYSLAEIREKIEEINFANHEGMKLAMDLLRAALDLAGDAQDGAKEHYQKIVDVLMGEENLFNFITKDFLEILDFASKLAQKFDLNIKSKGVDARIQAFGQTEKDYFSSASRLLKLLVPISQMGFSASHFQDVCHKSFSEMISGSINYKLLGENFVEDLVRSMLHAKNIGLLSKENIVDFLKKINRYYSRQGIKGQGVVEPNLAPDVFNNIFEIAAYGKAVFDVGLSDGFTRRFLGKATDLKLETTPLQYDVFEAIYRHLAFPSHEIKILEKDSDGRPTKVLIGDLIEVELEGKYCEIGEFFKSGDVVIRNIKEAKKIISIVEVDGREHEASIDSIRVDRGKYFSRDKIIEESCQIPLAIKHKDFSEFNRNRGQFVQGLLGKVKKKIEQDFEKEELERVERLQDEKRKIDNQAVAELARLNEEIVARMQESIEAISNPSDPRVSLEQRQEFLQQSFAALQQKINAVFAAAAFGALQSQDIDVARQEVEATSPAEELPTVGAESSSQSSDDSGEYLQQSKRRYNTDLEDEFEKCLLAKNYREIERILDSINQNQKEILNNFKFVDGEHQGKTALEFAIDSNDEDLPKILNIYGVTKLPDSYQPKDDHPFRGALEAIFGFSRPIVAQAEVGSSQGVDIENFVKNIVDSFLAGDLERFVLAMSELDAKTLQAIKTQELFSYQDSAKMTLPAFVIFAAVREKKIARGFVEFLAAKEFDFVGAEIVQGETKIPLLDFLILGVESKESQEIFDVFFGEIAYLAPPELILALAFSPDLKNKFFLEKTLEKFSVLEVADLMMKAHSQGRLSFCHQKPSIATMNLFSEAFATNDEDFLRIFIKNYQCFLTISQSRVRDEFFGIAVLLGGAVVRNNFKFVEFVLEKYPNLVKPETVAAVYFADDKLQEASVIDAAMRHGWDFLAGADVAKLLLENGADMSDDFFLKAMASCEGLETIDEKVINNATLIKAVANRDLKRFRKYASERQNSLRLFLLADDVESFLQACQGQDPQAFMLEAFSCGATKILQNLFERNQDNFSEIVEKNKKIITKIAIDSKDQVVDFLLKTIPLFFSQQLGNLSVGENALMAALQKGNFRVAKSLFEAGYVFCDGVLGVATSRAILFNTVAQREFDVAKILIATLNFAAIDDRGIVLQIAKSGNLDLVLEYAARHSAQEQDVQLKQEKYLDAIEKCLVSALESRQILLVGKILDAEKSFFCEDELRERDLRLIEEGIGNDSFEVVSQYLDSRHKSSVLNYQGQTALHILVQNGQFRLIYAILKYYETALDKAFILFGDRDGKQLNALEIVVNFTNEPSKDEFLKISHRIILCLIENVMEKIARRQEEKKLMADNLAKFQNLREMEVQELQKLADENSFTIFVGSKELKVNILFYAIYLALESEPFQATLLFNLLQKDPSLFQRCRSDNKDALQFLLALSNYYLDLRVSECVKIISAANIKFGAQKYEGKNSPLWQALNSNLQLTAFELIMGDIQISDYCVAESLRKQNLMPQIFFLLLEKKTIEFAGGFVDIDFEVSVAQNPEYIKFLKVAIAKNDAALAKILLRNHGLFGVESGDVGDAYKLKCKFLTSLLTVSEKSEEVSRFLDVVLQEYKNDLSEMAKRQVPSSVSFLRIAIQAQNAEFVRVMLRLGFVFSQEDVHFVCDNDNLKIAKVFAENNRERFEEFAKTHVAPNTFFVIIANDDVEALDRVNLDPATLRDIFLKAAKCDSRKILTKLGKEVDVADCQLAAIGAIKSDDLQLIQVLFEVIERRDISETEKNKYFIELFGFATKLYRLKALDPVLESFDEKRVFAILCQAFSGDMSTVGGIMRSQREFFAKKYPQNPEKFSDFINQEIGGKHILEIALEQDSQDKLGIAIQSFAAWNVDANGKPILKYKKLLFELMKSRNYDLLQKIISCMGGFLMVNNFAEFLNETDDQGCNLLFYAIRQGSAEMVDFLRARPIHIVGIFDDQGRNLAFAACEAAPEDAQLALDLAKKVCQRISLAADFFNKIHANKGQGQTLLMEAAQRGNLIMVTDLLATPNTAIFKKDEAGDNVLHYLARSKADRDQVLSCAQAVFSAEQNLGSFIGDRNKKGKAPIEIAIESGNDKLARFLIERGAINAQILNDANEMKLLKSMAKVTVSRREMLFDLAMKRCRTPALLLDIATSQNNDVSISKQEKHLSYFLDCQDGAGNTPLHLAVVLGDIQSINGFVKLGANKSVVNNSQNSPLHLAATLGKIEAIEALLDESEKLNTAKPAQKKDILQQRQENIDKKNAQGLAAIEIAISRGNIDIVELLLESGAKLDQEMLDKSVEISKSNTIAPDKLVRLEKFVAEFNEAKKSPTGVAAAATAGGQGKERPPISKS